MARKKKYSEEITKNGIPSVDEKELIPERIYQRKDWLEIAFQKKYQDIRDKIETEFGDLVFDEGPHKYYLGDRELECVSNTIHNFQEHFDTEAMAQKVYEAHFNDLSSKYYQMTPEEIIKEWNNISTTATTLGSARHNFGESIFWFMLNQFDKIVPEFKDRLHQDENGEYYMEGFYPKEKAVIKYWNDIPTEIVPILAENKVYSLEELYAGTFDILFAWCKDYKDENSPINGLYVMDYKTNVDLYKNFKGKKLLEPFNELLDNSLNIYKLQLSAYQNCLNKIGLKVIARALIWLRPNGEYEKIKLETYSNKLRDALQEKIKNGIIVPKFRK